MIRHVGLPPTFVALRRPAFRRIWIAGFGSMTGQWLQITGRAYLVYDVTGSKSALGAIYFFSYIPQLVLAPFAGVIADRFDRRRLLVVSQLLLAAGALAIGLLAAGDRATLLNVSALSLLIGIVQVVGGPASQAVVPSLVSEDELSSAVTLNSASVSATRIVGPLLAGVLIPAVGVAWAFYGTALGALALVFVWARTPLPRHDTTRVGGTLGAIRFGFGWVARTPRVRRPVIIVAVLSGIGLVYQPLGVPFATDILAHGDKSLGATYYGILQAALGAGSVVGILGFAGLGRRAPRLTMILTIVGFGSLLATFGLLHGLWPAALAIAGVGAFHFANFTLALDQVQHATPEEIRGRVLSIHSIAWAGLFPLTSAAAGPIADAVGVGPTLAGAGAICAAFGILYAMVADRRPDDDVDAVTGIAVQVEVA